MDGLLAGVLVLNRSQEATQISRFRPDPDVLTVRQRPIIITPPKTTRVTVHDAETRDGADYAEDRDEWDQTLADLARDTEDYARSNDEGWFYKD